MAVIRGKSDPREFIRAFNETLADLESMHSCTVTVSVVPAFSRSVLGVQLLAERPEIGTQPALREVYTLSWPTSQVCTLEALLYSAANRLLLMCMEADAANSARNTPHK